MKLRKPNYSYHAMEAWYFEGSEDVFGGISITVEGGFGNDKWTVRHYNRHNETLNEWTYSSYASARARVRKVFAERSK